MGSRRIIVLLLCGAGVLTSCADSYEPKTSVKFSFPYVDFAGRYRRDLTVDDVRQILALARAQPNIRKPVYQIEADSPNHANVSSGRSHEIGDVFTEFQVEKSNGRWKIVKSSIKTGPVAIITD
jgi:hypothetical protein